MPLLEIRKVAGGLLGLWLIRESAGELSSMVDAGGGGPALPSFLGTESRKREFLATRTLLSHMPGLPFRIGYLPGGRPCLPGSALHISISHSSEMAALLVLPHPAGIDTEVMTRDVSAVAGKFLSEEELAWTAAAADPKAAMLLCWCAKESVYKMAGDSTLRFREEIKAGPPAGTAEMDIPVRFRYGDKYVALPVRWFRAAGSLVAWCTHGGEEQIQEGY